METYESTCLNGKSKCSVLVAEYKDGSGTKWYVQKGGTIVNLTFDNVEGDINTIYDIDCFTWSSPIESLEELIEAIEA